MILSFSERNSRQQNQHYEDNNCDECWNHSPARLLAEISELLADSKPIRIRVPIVSQVNYGSGGSGTRSVQSKRHLPQMNSFHVDIYKMKCIICSNHISQLIIANAESN